jgi:hypothetical protein
MELEFTKCNKCLECKPLCDFYKGNSITGRQSWCKACHNEITAEWRRNNRERARELSRLSKARRHEHVTAYLRAHYAKHRSWKLAQAKQRGDALKAAAYRAYGGYRCSCCGETHPAFLSLDHVNNDGGRHRRAIGRGANIYRWLKTNNFPAGFQVLCHNCNHGKHINGGVCPHLMAEYQIQIQEV